MTSAEITAEITVTVETPAFVAASGEAPAELRMPSLRGAARYWFRLLAAPVFADNPAAVAAAEAEVFGAASGDAGGDGRPGRSRNGRDRSRGPSRVALRPLQPVPAGHDPQPSWLRGGAGPVNGIGYLLGPGIYQPPGRGGHPGLLRPHYLPPSQQVEDSPKGTFLVRVLDDGSDVPASYVAEVAGISLWAVATFGGIGARVHRGFGGLRFDGLDRLSPALAGAGATPPDHAHPVIQRLHELLAGRWERPEPPPRPTVRPGVSGPPWPAAPTWSRWYTQFSAERGTWVDRLRAAGLALRAFRAPVDRYAAPFAMTHLPAYRRWVTREYVDAVVPARAGRPVASPQFPLAAFGLPVVFQNATANLWRGGTELRRASPVWIRPHRANPMDSRGFRLLYHVLEAQIGPDDAELGLKVQNRAGRVALSLDERAAYRQLDAFLLTAP